MRSDNSGQHYGKACLVLVDRDGHSIFLGVTGCSILSFEERFKKSMIDRCKIIVQKYIGENNGKT